MHQLTDIPRHDGKVVKLHYKGQGEIKDILYFVGKVMDVAYLICGVFRIANYGRHRKATCSI